MSDFIFIDGKVPCTLCKIGKKIGNWPLEIKFGVLEFLCVHDGETRQTQNETEIMTPFSLWIN